MTQELSEENTNTRTSELGIQWRLVKVAEIKQGRKEDELWDQEGFTHLACVC